MHKEGLCASTLDWLAWVSSGTLFNFQFSMLQCWQSFGPFEAQYSQMSVSIWPHCPKSLLKSSSVSASAAAIASPFPSSLFTEFTGSLFCPASTGSFCLAWLSRSTQTRNLKYDLNFRILVKTFSCSVASFIFFFIFITKWRHVNLTMKCSKMYIFSYKTE